MKLELEIPDDLQARLSEEAAKAGAQIETYVLSLLAGGKHVPELATGSELVDYWEGEGLLGARTEILDSQKHARNLREKAQQRNLP